MNSKREAHADLISAEQFGVEELRAAVFGGSDRLDRVLALALLGRKNYPEKTRDLERVLAAEGESPRLRHAAAVALGREGTADARARLTAHLGERDPLVRRGVAEALGRLGEGRVPEPAAPGQGREALRTAADWPAILQDFRQGRERRELVMPAPDQLVQLDPGRARPIDVAPAPAERVARTLADLRQREQGLELTGAGALSLQCGDQQMLWLFHAPFATTEGARMLVERNAVVGVVAAHYTLEGDAWEVRYHVLTRPAARRGTIEILVLTAAGIEAFAGHAQVRGDAIAFALQAVRRPGVVPAQIEGVYEGGQLRIERAASDSRRSQPARPGERPPRT